MPVNLPNRLPAIKTLQEENVFVMTQERAESQDIRPLEIGIVNLMPTKIVTETQLIRLLSNTPLQIEITLIQMGGHISLNTSQEHLRTFYHTFEDIRDKQLDGLIITGAPVETLPFEEVDYWQELCRLMEWSKTHVFSTFHICWAAQAGLYYHYSVNKYPLAEKIFGIFDHQVLSPKTQLVRGFDSDFPAPHSRHSTIREAEVLAAGIRILSKSEQAGVYIAVSPDQRQIFVTGHPEYDALSLDAEYQRDLDRKLPIKPPVGYYPDDNPQKPPLVRWRAHAHLLFANWLNYYVYQETPYDITAIAVRKSKSEVRDAKSEVSP